MLALPRWLRLDGSSPRPSSFTPKEALTAEDIDVLRAVESKSERFAAWSRTALVILLSLALVPLVQRGMVDVLALKIIAVNAGLSLLGLLLSRGRRLPAWIPWMLGLLDVAFIVGYVAFFSRFGATLPGPFRTAVVANWGAFLAIALSAMRGRPWLLATQTVLLVGGIALSTGMAPRFVLPDVELYRELTIVYGPGQNTARLLVLGLAGAILAISTMRARRNLRRAVAATRRATALSSYLAPAVASVVAETTLEALREGRQQDVGVLFADVRGFTAFAEKLPPRDVAAFLTDFRVRATAAIELEGGVVDKFVGDEVMGLFGVPTPAPDDARRAVRAGKRLQAAMQVWSHERERVGYPPVRVGIGVHHGPVFIGAIGEGRLEFTVLGDTVNVARRLEQMTKSAGYDLIVTAAALRTAGSSGGATHSWTALPKQAIPGHREPVRVFAFAGEGAAAEPVRSYANR